MENDNTWEDEDFQRQRVSLSSIEQSTHTFVFFFRAIRESLRESEKSKVRQEVINVEDSEDEYKTEGDEGDDKYETITGPERGVREIPESFSSRR